MAAASLDGVVRRQADEASRPALVALVLLAAGAAVGLAHLAGADVRAGLAGGQPHLLPGLLTRALARQGTVEL